MTAKAEAHHILTRFSSPGGGLDVTEDESASAFKRMDLKSGMKHGKNKWNRTKTIFIVYLINLVVVTSVWKIYVVNRCLWACQMGASCPAWSLRDLHCLHLTQKVVQVICNKIKMWGR